MVRLCCGACEAVTGVVADATLPEIETDIGDPAPVPEPPSSVPPVPLPAEGEFSESDVTAGWLLTFMLDPSILTE